MGGHSHFDYSVNMEYLQLHEACKQCQNTTNTIQWYCDLSNQSCQIGVKPYNNSNLSGFHSIAYLYKSHTGVPLWLHVTCHSKSFQINVVPILVINLKFKIFCSLGIPINTCDLLASSECHGQYTCWPFKTVSNAYKSLVILTIWMANWES